MNLARTSRAAKHAEVSSFAPMAGTLHQPRAFAALHLARLDAVPFQWTLTPRGSQALAQASMDLLGHKAHSWREGWRFVFSLRRMFLEYSDGQENIQVRNDKHQAEESQWTFAAAVHDGEHIALYVDGQEVAKQPAVKAVPSKHAAILDNYVADKKTYGFIGVMDEFIILKQALTAEELVELGTWTRRKSSASHE